MGTGPIRVAVTVDIHGVFRPKAEDIFGTYDVIVHTGDFGNQILCHKLNVIPYAHPRAHETPFR